MRKPEMQTDLQGLQRHCGIFGFFDRILFSYRVDAITMIKSYNHCGYATDDDIDHGILVVFHL